MNITIQVLLFIAALIVGGYVIYKAVTYIFKFGSTLVKLVLKSIAIVVAISLIGWGIELYHRLFA